MVENFCCKVFCIVVFNYDVLKYNEVIYKCVWGRVIFFFNRVVFLNCQGWVVRLSK